MGPRPVAAAYACTERVPHRPLRPPRPRPRSLWDAPVRSETRAGRTRIGPLPTTLTDTIPTGVSGPRDRLAIVDRRLFIAYGVVLSERFVLFEISITCLHVGKEER